MTINKELVRKNFSRHAFEYDLYAKIQKVMAIKLLQLVQHNTSKSYLNILEIGCGTGNLTKLLLEYYPNAKYTVFDLSESMIQQTKRKIGGMQKNIEFFAVDAERILSHDRMKEASDVCEDIFEQTYDLIISNATFQWFNAPKQTIKAYLNCLNANGVFAFSTFGPDTFYELHTSFYEVEKQLNIVHQQHGQKFMSMNEWQQVCKQQMNEICTVEEKITEQYRSVREFMHHVKRVGAGNASKHESSQADSGINRRLILNMEKYYTQHFASTQGVQATYHLCYGVYEK
ncbi:malonyl-ACP O-methyltransferase BioC [Chengkuizengella marina]|uniref:Malonyl-[acyl-carrier protein] O-methyltransferase n=1 Tax=Chengkuizengella marina TaxID=2507566 RepID=A0A6N9Q234_9BACL|nr:malonyl-ACP O-methyltransferase BioC [Chengkuizengella marina]NBI28540.1 malonyl-[acyl-carrier protein] O-methyltransferase BioC [Chengkuizengella marina]